MHRLFVYTSLIAAVALTLLSGVLYGKYNERWGVSQEAQQLAQSLENLPEEFGEWRFVEANPLSSQAQKILQCHGQLGRVYQNQRSGETVTVAVILGPSGPTSVHKPSICYSSRDYEITKQESIKQIDTGIGAQSLWFTEFESKGLEKHTMRTYHAWTFDGAWQAPREPRLTYMWNPYLFKIQVSAVLPQGKTTEDDAGLKFLQDFIPQVNDQLFPKS